ncbi:hypothetical protein LOD99_3031 [Oopsacas minuta]|uniref:PH domain-containing protein n=1 Tax=Oopsacas minuta TaxID=111878 RepID=A0AAV7JZ13_9METZ|nr:hypothetical protein LOD99_3031 [Oopsacas minuta]
MYESADSHTRGVSLNTEWLQYPSSVYIIDTKHTECMGCHLAEDGLECQLSFSLTTTAKTYFFTASANDETKKWITAITSVMT